MREGSSAGPFAPLTPFTPSGKFTPLTKFLGLALVVRPLNLVAIALAAWVGARLGSRELDAAAILIPVLIGAFRYARNDAVDLAADRVNRPGRPVPSGAISPSAAGVVSWTALGVAALILAAVPRGAFAWGAAIAASVALFAYSPWLKDRGAAGPLAIAALTSLAVIWGAAEAPHAERALLPALLAGAAQFARECVKQLEDAPGDRAAGRTTWAIRGGIEVVKRAAKLGLLAALLLLPLPTTAGGLSARYLSLALPTAGLIFLWALAALAGASPRYSQISAGIKLALFCGLAALALTA